MWAQVDEVVRWNQMRVLAAFQAAGVAQYELNGTTGYGYNDAAREAVEKVYSHYFQTEAALVRPQIVSGTHALACALFGLLRPGDELLALGRPYDTLAAVIGIAPTAGGGEAPGNLREFGISYREVPMPSEEWETSATDAGTAAEEMARKVVEAVGPRTRALLLQRSRGYAARPSLPVAAIATIIAALRQAKPDVMVIVDNCYGEFVETREPSMVGADLVAGSLIKNPGGGLAPTGGYLVGRKDLIARAAARLTAPGVGAEVGPYFGFARPILQGFFLAPHVVGEAVRGAILAAAFFSRLGWKVSPPADAPRTDIIQAIHFPAAEPLIRAAQAVQAASPIDSHVRPVPAPMPGYDDMVIMAAGTFVQGASLELTADAPLRPPFTLYWQGGLTREHVEVALALIYRSLASLLEPMTISAGRSKSSPQVP
ncbi:MAG: methionine gamma-lyase family protein [Limnochordales bacterium]|nr:methionine gamma-lyase family protein [Limnochordales bacterium]